MTVSHSVSLARFFHHKLLLRIFFSFFFLLLFECECDCKSQINPLTNYTTIYYELFQIWLDAFFIVCLTEWDKQKEFGAASCCHSLACSLTHSRAHSNRFHIASKVVTKILFLVRTISFLVSSSFCMLHVTSFILYSVSGLLTFRHEEKKRFFSAGSSSLYAVHTVPFTNSSLSEDDDDEESDSAHTDQSVFYEMQQKTLTIY